MKRNLLFKHLAVIVIFVVFITGFTGNVTIASTSEHPELKVYVDDKELQFPDAKPYINEVGRTMVPIRAIAESFGAKVEWDDILRRVIITHDDIEIRFYLNDDKDFIHITDLEEYQYKSVPIGSKPVIRNNRTFVPYRAITEAFGYNVYWDASEYKVIIDTKNKRRVFLINPALCDNYYQCIDNMGIDFDELIPHLKMPEIRVVLTDKDREYYFSMVKSHVEHFIGNVDYSKEFVAYYPDAPFTGIMRAVYKNAVENSIIREVKLIAGPSDLEVLADAEIFTLAPTDAVVVGRLEFIYHEASDEYLDRFEGKLKKGVWYTTKIAVLLSLQRGLLDIDRVFLDNTFEELI
ncbi:MULTISPECIES: copper amine oxidase N-terminal domain-containing protein [Acetivibrio]|jgi:hypothetical protein|uniref:Copper amine oxidase n=2 Tax=Acetivibrio TaxID=35829 RepID=A0A2S8R778_9FIRM|nr:MULTISPECIES: copper amine oxidase N-terminal domain-containing protein [Acetivibrio]PQQ65656.1 copper amine oxidase [Acetivibrio saccincola]GAE86867.1 hypothetical protein JCM21531_197 [Acetivibrio straminisolvens JCM 21531]